MNRYSTFFLFLLLIALSSCLSESVPSPENEAPDSTDLGAPFGTNPSAAPWDEQQFPAGLGAPPRINEHRRFDLVSGKIEYQLSGVDRGTETFYFDSWGVKEAHYRYTQPNEPASVEIMTLDWVYHSNPESKAANFLWKSEDIEGPIHLGWLSQATMISGGAELVGYEDLLGHTCKVWEDPGSGRKTWTWRFLTLRSEMPVDGGKRIKEATSLEVGIEVPEERFQIPESAATPDPAQLRGLMDRLNNLP